MSGPNWRARPWPQPTPHLLTAYQQEQAGGGIPDNLWQHVQAIQQEHWIAILK
jgi:hypothetical protein